mgnify:CR=1 FL=1
MILSFLKKRTRKKRSAQTWLRTAVAQAKSGIVCKIAWLDRPNALIQIEDKNDGLIITCLVEPGTNRVALDPGTILPVHKACVSCLDHLGPHPKSLVIIEGMSLPVLSPTADVNDC